jgi:RNA polymerase sigma-70 factor (ECF subfamily)
MKNVKFADSQLVEYSRNGDQAAFGELAQRHRQKCVDLAYYFLRNHGDAEDQVQIALLKAYEHLDQYQGDAEFATWLSRIVANQCLMLLRVRRRARYLYLDEEPAEPKTVPLQLPASGPDPEGEVAYQQMSQVLRKEIRHIPHILRHVMVLRDVQGLPLADVAGRLGISVPAAKSRLVRARTELRSRMTRHVKGIRYSPALARSAAPLSRVGRHRALQAV